MRSRTAGDEVPRCGLTPRRIRPHPQSVDWRSEPRWANPPGHLGSRRRGARSPTSRTVPGGPGASRNPRADARRTIRRRTPDGGYDLLGATGDRRGGARATRPCRRSRIGRGRSGRGGSAPVEDRPRRAGAGPAELVDQVWSRGPSGGRRCWSCWPSARRVLGLAYWTFDVENLAPADDDPVRRRVSCWLVLSYPIVITLERPVRVTPEQAVKDYLRGPVAPPAALPADVAVARARAGRISGAYGSFEGFRAYWKRRLAELRGDRVCSSTTPGLRDRGLQIGEERAVRTSRRASTP